MTVGFKPKRNLIRLDFSQTELAGLEVVTRSVSIDSLLKFIELVDALDGTDAKELAAQDMTGLFGKVDDLFGRFAAVLVEWNVEEDDDTPVPATKAGLLSQDFDFVMQVIGCWIESISSAPPPLPGASPSGATTPEESLGLGESSRSRPSS